MSMEIKNSYGRRTENYQHKKSVPHEKKNRSEAPAESKNTDVLAIGTGAAKQSSMTEKFAPESYEDYFRKRLDEVAKALPELAKNADNGETVTFSEWYGKRNITLSEDSKTILAGVSERKAASRAATEAFKAESPDNAFIGTGSMKPQSDVFIDELKNGGFFDDMEEDKAREMRSILRDVTSEMDKLNNGWIPTDLKSEISHEGARLELISSVSALRHFSDTFVPDELKESFNSLIEQYESYNTVKVDNHKNIYDMRDESMKNMPPPNAVNVSEAVKQTQRESEASSEIGRVTHTSEQKKANAAEYMKLFDELRSGGSDSAESVFEKLQKTFLNYASGGSKNDVTLTLLASRNSSSMRHMANYWNALFKQM